MDLKSIQNTLQSYNVQEPAQTTRFRGGIDVGNYGSAPIIIELRDHGDLVIPDYRYSCAILSDDGQLLVTGNGGSTPDEAIDSVHWQSLEHKLVAWLERPRNHTWGDLLGES